MPLSWLKTKSVRCHEPALILKNATKNENLFYCELHLDFFDEGETPGTSTVRKAASGETRETDCLLVHTDTLVLAADPYTRMTSPFLPRSFGLK